MVTHPKSRHPAPDHSASAQVRSGPSARLRAAVWLDLGGTATIKGVEVLLIHVSPIPGCRPTAHAVLY